MSSVLVILSTERMNTKKMLQGFPPVSSPEVNTLILGSMPGKDSLRFNQYYAHPRNSFWPIMLEILGVASDIAYEDKLEILKENRIGLWDVIQCCRRESSLDSAIDEDSIVVNDFCKFLNNHRGVDRIFFNGIKAEQSYKRYVQKELCINTIIYQRLPSTSMANARLNYQQKLAAWQGAIMVSR